MSDQTSEIRQFLEEAAATEPEPPKKGRVLRNTLIVVGVLLALVGIAIGTVYGLVAKEFNEVERISIEQDPTLERPEPVVIEAGEKAPVNILLLGSDSRDTTDPNVSIDELSGFRSDAILVAQISPERDHVTVMSIMRDNWVTIQHHGLAKINAAVAYGGVPLAVNTVENFVGSRIDHVALIDFDSFKGLTDAVGGVTVHNTIAYTAQNGGGGYFFDQGDITLDGPMALSFVRERYAFSDGDYQRVRNQQAYIKGLAKKVLSQETLSSPDKLVSMFDAMKPYLVLDDGFSLNTAVGMGVDLRGIRGDDITFFTSPTLGTGTSVDGQSIVLPDFDELEHVKAAFREGTLHEYAATRGPGSEAP